MKIIFSDFDGTLTNNGKLGAVFFDILDLIKKNNSELIVVSGRSLSWGHFILTHFPIDYAIMEGGGVIIYRDDKGHIQEENLLDQSTIDKLEMITQKLIKDVPEVIMSADSFGRRADRAIEIFQMDKAAADKTEKYLKDHNVNFSKSDVHLNFWLEDLSKANAVSLFLKKYKPQVKEQDCLYFGDAPNDQSMFKYFEHTIGVSNISHVIDKLTDKPQIVLEGVGNEGANGVFNYLAEFFK